MDYDPILKQLYDERTKLTAAIEQLEKLETGPTVDGGPKWLGRKSMGPEERKAVSRIKPEKTAFRTGQKGLEMLLGWSQQSSGTERLKKLHCAFLHSAAGVGRRAAKLLEPQRFRSLDLKRHSC